MLTHCHSASLVFRPPSLRGTVSRTGSKLASGSPVPSPAGGHRRPPLDGVARAPQAVRGPAQDGARPAPCRAALPPLDAPCGHPAPDVAGWHRLPLEQGGQSCVSSLKRESHSETKGVFPSSAPAEACPSGDHGRGEFANFACAASAGPASAWSFSNPSWGGSSAELGEKH